MKFILKVLSHLWPLNECQKRVNKIAKNTAKSYSHLAMELMLNSKYFSLLIENKRQREYRIEVVGKRKRKKKRKEKRKRKRKRKRKKRDIAVRAITA